MSHTPSAASRREFLRHTARLAAYGTAAPLALQLSAIGSAAAQTPAQGYRALVCVFLYGGNDGHNTVIPFDTARHAEYASLRGALALKREDLSGTVLPRAGWDRTRSYALHPALKPLHTAVAQDRLAVGFNVGTLVRPLSKADYRANQHLPPKLFSHNDQFNLWQALQTEGAQSGWGGRMGDLLASRNPDRELPTNLTIGPTAVFSSGLTSLEHALPPLGPLMPALSDEPAVQAAIDRALRDASAHAMRRELQARYSRAHTANTKLQQALQTTTEPSMPATGIGRSLGLVARLVQAGRNVGARRQIFFVSLDGFDTHTDQLNRQRALLADLGQALAGFQAAIDAQGASEQVTTFTASDFGRALTPNGSGTDHGWGSHLLVMGGAVRRGSSFGAEPSLTLDGDDDIGQGRLLPAVSVDQVGATLARWMGVQDSDMPTVFPNITEFSNRNLGFLRS